MFQSDETTATKTSSTAADATTSTTPAKLPGKPVAVAASSSVKDAGRVHVGAGMMRF